MFGPPKWCTLVPRFGVSMTDDDLLVGASEPGEGDALHSFGPVAKTNEHFSMKLGALKSAEAPL